MFHDCLMSSEYTHCGNSAFPPARNYSKHPFSGLACRLLHQLLKPFLSLSRGLFLVLWLVESSGHVVWSLLVLVGRFGHVICMTRSCFCILNISVGIYLSFYLFPWALRFVQCRVVFYVEFVVGMPDKCLLYRFLVVSKSILVPKYYQLNVWRLWCWFGAMKLPPWAAIYSNYWFNVFCK